MSDLPPVRVAALYQFTRLAGCAELREPLACVCAQAGVKGILLLAPEGINGTIAGSVAGVAAVLDHVRSFPGCAAPDVKYSEAAAMPFQRMRVRLKKEIVTMGRPDLDPGEGAGAYVEAGDWNALIADPDTVLIDTRNAYEVGVGSFAGAVDPGLGRFRDFPAWLRANRDALAGKRLAMFCTGGIRCEKATALALAEGAGEVFHLKGGILRYLETVSADESRWRGECFVFDERVAVGHGLAQGTHRLCRPCGMPVAAGEPECPRCSGTTGN